MTETQVIHSLLTFSVVHLVNCYIVFHFLMIFFINYVSLRYIQSSLDDRVATFIFENAANSACHLFILWLLNCICLSLPLVLGAPCGPDVSVPEIIYLLC